MALPHSRCCRRRRLWVEKSGLETDPHAVAAGDTTTLPLPTWVSKKLAGGGLNPEMPSPLSHHPVNSAVPMWGFLAFK